MKSVIRKTSVLLPFILLFLVQNIQSQSWWRRDCVFILNKGQILQGQTDPLSNEWELFMLTSNTTIVRKFYQDHETKNYILKFEVLENDIEPLFFVKYDNNVFALSLALKTIDFKAHYFINIGEIFIRDGMYKISTIEESGQFETIFVNDNPENAPIKAEVLSNPQFVNDTSLLNKKFSQIYDYAYPLTNNPNDKPKGIKIYQMEIFE